MPGLLVPPLHAALVRLSRRAATSRAVHRALRALAGLVGTIKVGNQDFNISLDITPEPGLADSGNLDADLTALIETVGEAAREQDTALALFIDELQYVTEGELSALIAALHRAAQRQLPVTLVGAGLPQLVARTAPKSYAERLFTFPEIGPLSDAAARLAIEAPANRLGVAFDDNALAMVLRETGCYPYFLQEWGKHCWDCACLSRAMADVETASREATRNSTQASFAPVSTADTVGETLSPSHGRARRRATSLGRNRPCWPGQYAPWHPRRRSPRA